MNNWKKYKLGDTINLIKDGYNPSSNEHLHYIGLEHIEQQTLRLSGIGKSSDVTSNKFRFKSGDILFGKLRPYFRKVYRPNFDGVCSTDIWVVRAKKNFDQGFLFYLMANQEFIDLSSQGSSGTRMPRADWNNLKSIDFSLPDLKAQIRIASILSSLDNKIELNRRMNQTLEQIAATLFKKYFVDEIDPDDLPEGWRLDKLKTHITIKNGYAFKGYDFCEEGIAVLKIKNVKANKVILDNLSFVPKEIADTVQKYRVNKYDLLITMSGNRLAGTPETWVGKAGIFPKVGEYLLNQRISIINLNDDAVLSRFYISQLFSTDEMQYYFASSATSSGGQANISPDLIYNTEVVVPPKQLMIKFNKIIESIYKKMFANEAENECLSSIRDILLPKLMSGEIDVTAINLNERLHEEVLI